MNTQTTIQRDLTIKVRDHIQAEAEKADAKPWSYHAGAWFQKQWFHLVDKSREVGPITPEHACGTTGCVAGWAIIFSGDYRAEVANDWGERIVRITEIETGDRTSEHGGYVWSAEDDYQVNRDWETRGAEVLGLDPDDAALLFHEDNPLDLVLTMLNNIIATGHVEMDYLTASRRRAQAMDDEMEARTQAKAQV